MRYINNNIRLSFMVSLFVVSSFYMNADHNDCLYIRHDLDRLLIHSKDNKTYHQLNLIAKKIESCKTEDPSFGSEGYRGGYFDLEKAVFQRDFQVTQLLITLGADKSHNSYISGTTLLRHNIRESENFRSSLTRVPFLLEAGADATEVDQYGRSLVDDAISEYIAWDRLAKFAKRKDYKEDIEQGQENLSRAYKNIELLIQYGGKINFKDDTTLRNSMGGKNLCEVIIDEAPELLQIEMIAERIAAYKAQK
ncbi:hypothetical protein KBC04_04175 [Candidatus Babeliales bacterium]|nr:hypothetical protein [Candidatus Babeliales bacterium]MBP9843306.1 hypothetical protein [Candidatus Babeliales bacterium]